ncbi:formate-dependent phosphoribosylglycinamide formyltransferase [Sphingomonas sp. BN140010]|uniref:Formate-dependent phosphoribosylglycinamide formyltransferase n=1 Tax=Sphingomonas arvum TaxID=2992113 RepID=A0ABT3JB36_9SPHN|nr:formate-dependent phosphoribosylglycinamide formyltransferase [Sphingomonas sp. BN140010]MCW3796267.1 formate-dependent phosphoribosylglycinamide formyltransferase [Sphingomonas sp. BN140010]
MWVARLMLLGSGELGREFAIAAKRLGCAVIACDRYAGAPAMQVADASEVFSMLDGAALRAAVEKHQPDVIVPEIEAIDTVTLARLEAEGWRVAPSANAAQLTMNRDGIRDFAAQELGLETSRYRFAESREEALAAAEAVGLPCVVKPVMSSSGKGQSVARTAAEVGSAWDHAVANMRGDRPRVIVEEFISFDTEITLLTVAAADGIHFCAPIGHVQEAGDYRESWQPAAVAPVTLRSAQEQAAKVVEALGGRGLFGVEFFIAGDRAIFSELSPRPHDTGMVTLVSQQPNEFELHLRAILGLPVAPITLAGPSASAVILADRDSERFAFEGVGEALATGAELRLFGKPRALPGRRMGVALARGAMVEEARTLALEAAGRVRIRYEGN